MMKTVYFDNSATTALSPKAAAAMTEAMAVFGNPSSLHRQGTEAAALLRRCRETVGEALKERYLKDGQLIFTSCGTEANALAIQGTAHAKKRRSGTVLTTDSEHPSVENNLRRLEAEGFRVIRLSTREGVLHPEEAEPYLNSDLLLVTAMLVNNETGARYSVEKLFSAAHAANPDCVCHCDATQGFLKVPMSPRSLGADLVTVSAHKIHGPKGVGALFIAAPVLTSKRISPFLLGGGQEYGLRSGTENVIGIAGFAAAAAEGMSYARENAARMQVLCDRLTAGLSDIGIRVNRPPVAAPHIVSLTLPQIKSETMLHFLSDRGIAVSSGSACSSHAKHPSTVLLAFGLTAAEADCTLRISFCPENTSDEVDMLLDLLRQGTSQLVRINH